MAENENADRFVGEESDVVITPPAAAAGHDPAQRADLTPAGRQVAISNALTENDLTSRPDEDFNAITSGTIGNLRTAITGAFLAGQKDHAGAPDEAAAKAHATTALSLGGYATDDAERFADHAKKVAKAIGHAYDAGQALALGTPPVAPAAVPQESPEADAVPTPSVAKATIYDTVTKAHALEEIPVGSGYAVKGPTVTSFTSALAAAHVAGQTAGGMEPDTDAAQTHAETTMAGLNVVDRDGSPAIGARQLAQSVAQSFVTGHRLSGGSGHPEADARLSDAIAGGDGGEIHAAVAAHPARSFAREEATKGDGAALAIESAKATLGASDAALDGGGFALTTPGALERAITMAHAAGGEHVGVKGDDDHAELGAAHAADVTPSLTAQAEKGDGADVWLDGPAVAKALDTAFHVGMSDARQLKARYEGAAGEKYPTQRGDLLMVKPGAVPFKKTPVGEDKAWDADAAIGRLRAWSGVDEDKPSPEAYEKYAQGFALVDGDPKNLTSYSLPHHDVEGGKLVVSKAGVVAASNAVQGARSGKPMDLGDQADAVKAHLDKERELVGLDPLWSKKPDEKKDNEARGAVPTPDAPPAAPAAQADDDKPVTRGLFRRAMEALFGESEKRTDVAPAPAPVAASTPAAQPAPAPESRADGGAAPVPAPKKTDAERRAAATARLEKRRALIQRAMGGMTDFSEEWNKDDTDEDIQEAYGLLGACVGSVLMCMKPGRPMLEAVAKQFNGFLVALKEIVDDYDPTTDATDDDGAPMAGLMGPMAMMRAALPLLVVMPGKNGTGADGTEKREGRKYSAQTAADILAAFEAIKTLADDVAAQADDDEADDGEDDDEPVTVAVPDDDEEPDTSGMNDEERAACLAEHRAKKDAKEKAAAEQRAAAGAESAPAATTEPKVPPPETQAPPVGGDAALASDKTPVAPAPAAAPAPPDDPKLAEERAALAAVEKENAEKRAQLAALEAEQRKQAEIEAARAEEQRKAAEEKATLEQRLEAERAKVAEEKRQAEAERDALAGKLEQLEKRREASTQVGDPILPAPAGSSAGKSSEKRGLWGEGWLSPERVAKPHLGDE